MGTITTTTVETNPGTTRTLPASRQSERPDDMRIGTPEREDAIRVLGDHFAVGRLFMDEYEQRVGAAIDARTGADLRSQFDDLPAPHPAFMVAAAGPPAPLAPMQPIYPSNARVGCSDRSRVAAGLLQIMFPFGTGRFYTGHTRIAVTQLVLVLVGVGVIWSLVDGVLLLAIGGTDPHGRPLHT